MSYQKKRQAVTVMETYYDEQKKALQETKNQPMEYQQEVQNRMPQLQVGHCDFKVPTMLPPSYGRGYKKKKQAIEATQETKTHPMQYEQQVQNRIPQLQNIRANGVASSSRSFSCGANTQQSKYGVSLTGELNKNANEMLSQEHQNTEALSIIFNHTRYLKSLHDMLLQDVCRKKKNIKGLAQEIKQMKNKTSILYSISAEINQKLFCTSMGELTKKMSHKNKLVSEMMSQINDAMRKYGSIIEPHAQKKIENDRKIKELQDENTIKDGLIECLKGNLERAMWEIKKNQNIEMEVKKKLAELYNAYQNQKKKSGQLEYAVCPETSLENVSNIWKELQNDTLLTVHGFSGFNGQGTY